MNESKVHLALQAEVVVVVVLLVVLFSVLVVLFSVVVVVVVVLVVVVLVVAFMDHTRSGLSLKRMRASTKAALG